MRRSKEGEVNRCWIRDVIARSGIREVREAVAVGAILHIAVLFCLCLNVVLYTLGASSLYEMNASHSLLLSSSLPSSVISSTAHSIGQHIRHLGVSPINIAHHVITRLTPAPQLLGLSLS